MKLPWFALLGLLCAPIFAEERKPNIVILYGDDVGYGDLGCHGAKGVTTPNIDRLASQSLDFSAGYCASSTCTPSRFSLLTGAYPIRQQDTGILPGDAPLIIKPGTTTLPSILKQAGYVTGVVGKWHLGLGDGNLDWNGSIKPSPNDIGFDESFIMAATGDRVPTVFIRNHQVVNLDPSDPIEVSYKLQFPGEPDGKKDRGTLKMDWSQGHNMAVVNGIGRIGFMKGGTKARWNDETLAADFTKEATGFIERNKEKPFFLFFATHDIHVPRVPNPMFKGKSTMGPRGDSIVQFDWQVGQVMETLDRLGLSENTLVILSSDNGPVLDDGYKDEAVEKLGEHKPAGPYRGGKYSLFEGGTRVPTLLRWTGKVKPGSSDAMISQVDFAASFAAMTGAKFGDKDLPDSFNILPALLGESKTGRTQLIEHSQFGGGRLAIREGEWKFIETGKGDGKAAKPALFNLTQDLAETTDVSAANPEVVARLSKELAAIRKAEKTRP
jgi:arylsulfatase A-like enzyme